MYLHLAPFSSIHPLIDPFVFIDVHVSVEIVSYQTVSVVFCALFPGISMGFHGYSPPGSDPFSQPGSNDSRSPKSPKVRHPWKMENVALDCSTDRLESSSLRIFEDAPSFVWKEVILCLAQQQLKQRAHYIVIYCIYLEITGSFGDFNPETPVCFQTCRG